MQPDQIQPGYNPQQYQQQIQPAPPQAASQMKKHHPWVLIMLLVVFILATFGATGFGFWAYGGMQDYKNHSDDKSAKAVAIAVQDEDSKKENEFLEREKKPTKIYQGPEAFGSVSISYPKTWGAYVIEQDRASTPVDGYFHPSFVPGTQTGTAYALRVQVTNQAYAEEMRQFDSKVKGGKVKVTPFTAKNVPNITGARVEGEINNGQKDVMILVPLRDKTLKISTEAQQFVGDFDNIILADLKFVP